jgi:hypothetical protein
MHRAVALIVVLAGCSHSGGRLGDGDDGKADGDSSPDAGAFTASPHAPFPTVTLHGGASLSPLRIITVVAANEPLQQDLIAFSTELPTSAWANILTSDYGISSITSGGSIIGTSLAAGTTLPDAAIRSYVRAAISSAPSAQPDGHTVYLLLLPPDVRYAGSNCHAGNGYNEPFGSLGDSLAIVERCANTYFGTNLELLTSVGGHEIAEGATDTDWGRSGEPTVDRERVGRAGVWLPGSDRRLLRWHALARGRLHVPAHLLEHGGARRRRSMRTRACHPVLLGEPGRRKRPLPGLVRRACR